MGFLNIIIIGLVTVSIAAGMLRVRRVQRAWQLAANELGFALEPGHLTKNPRMAGSIRGVQVIVDIELRGGGEDRPKYTRYTLNYQSGAPQITLTKQGFGSIFKRLFGGRDVAIGDPGFDQRVVIDAADPTHAAQFLSPARRMAVLSLFEAWNKASVSQGSFVVQRRGVETSSAALTTSVRRLVDIALIISEPTDVDRALEHQAQGDVQDAVSALHEVNEGFQKRDEPNSFTQLLEAEALMTIGDGAAASEVLATITTGVDTEVAGWRQAAAAHRKPPQDSVRPDPETPDVPAAEDTAVSDLHQQAVIDDLFSSSRLGYETEEHFLRVYAGRPIRWSGEIEQIREFRSDAHFDGSGLKTIVLLGNLGDGRLLTSRVNAIVHFPDGTTIGRGDSITFTGNLRRVDRYMRNLFVSDGIVVEKSVVPRRRDSYRDPY
ncbi:MAG: hypothetical protein ACI81L_001041 [Verrucomicrobiales bacterium]|jgi:hypothetical protein